MLLPLLLLVLPLLLPLLALLLLLEWLLLLEMTHWLSVEQKQHQLVGYPPAARSQKQLLEDKGVLAWPVGAPKAYLASVVPLLQLVVRQGWEHEKLALLLGLWCGLVAVWR